MAVIYRGTTPTILYKFRKVDPNRIVEGFLTIRQGPDFKRLVLEKPLSEATLGEMTLSWDLTQEETLKLREKEKGKVYFNYLLDNQKRGVGKELAFDAVTSGKDEVITYEISGGN